MDVKNPVLLKGQTLSPERTIRPYTLKLTVVENGVSNGSMVIGPDEPTINVGAWLRVWTCQGDMGVYRVTSINHDVTGQKRTINFEHLINALSDSIIFHEVKATDIDPNAATAGGATVTKTIENALAYQRNEFWKLGKCEFSDRQMFNFLQQTVWDAVQSVLNTLEGYVLRFKMDELPFTLRVEKEETAATCEMRLNRNLSTMQKSINRSDMFTRLYPVGAKDLHINDVNDGKAYIMQNHGLYGVIEATKQEPSITDAKELLAWGKAQLKKFSKPSVTITISGLELSGSTGLAIDKLVVGTMCNVPLPDFGTVETERITQLAWADVLAKPEAVTVTMANNRKTVQGIVQQVQQQQKKAKARDDKDDTDKDKEYHTWFEKTDESITAGAARITDAEAAVSELKITAKQIKSDVTALDRRTGDIEKSTVIQNADKITDMVGNFSFDKNGNLIIANAGGLILKKDKTEIGLYKNGKLDAGMIVEALNDGTTTTKIKGNMVEISGTTILGLLKGKTITAKNIAADDTVSGAYLSGKLVKAGDHNTVFIEADGTIQNIPSIHTEALFVHAAGVFPELYADVTDAVFTGSTESTPQGINIVLKRFSGEEIKIPFSSSLSVVTMSHSWATGGNLTVSAKAPSTGTPLGSLGIHISADTAGATWEEKESLGWVGSLKVFNNIIGSQSSVDTGAVFNFRADPVYNDGYSKGKKSVTGEAPRSWLNPGDVVLSQNTSVCFLSNGNQISLTVRLGDEEIDENNIRTRRLYVNDISTHVRDVIDLGATYNQGVEDGKAAVTLSEAWTSDATAETATHTVSTVGRTTALSKSATLKIKIDDWNTSNKALVYLMEGNILRLLSVADAGTVYTKGYNAGYAAVNPSGYYWDGNISNSEIFISTTMPGRTDHYNRMSLSLLGGTSFDKHKSKVTLRFKSPTATGTGSVKATLEVDATSEYNAGLAAGAADAQLSDFSWDDTKVTTLDKNLSIGITGTTKKKSLRFAMSDLAWADGQKYVFLSTGKTLNQNVMRLTVEIPTITQTPTTGTGQTATTFFTLKASCGGKTTSFQTKLIRDAANHLVKLVKTNDESMVYANIYVP